MDKITSVWAVFVFILVSSQTDAKSKECRDTFHSCSNWSSAGMCHDAKFGFVMRGGCSKTCGFCKGEDTSSTTDKPKPTKASVLTTVTTARIKKESGVDSTIPPYKKDGCVDVFPKCAEWKKNSNMCSNPKLAPFLRFGCANSCAFCSKGSSITTPSPPTVPIPSGKSGEAAFIDHDSAVEMGIAKEIGQNDKKSKLSNHASEKTAKSSKQIYVLKREDKEPDSKRVEIETGDDTGADPVSSLSRLGDDLPKILKGSPDSVNLAAFDDLPEAFRGSKLEDKVAGFVGKAGKKKFDYFTEHYSKDPYIAEYQREEWMRNNGVMGKPYRRWLKNKKE
ncbi:uncharacterized protein LOC5507228 isoform X2 [Nematostella vectensis]|uniref:uncharacterized protein LOC5507228 isoform X2 n=1 Tax=Nematostella vectensis TaxID=45351 RepID=UPI00207796D9|nr:uncharacterized protein LOC5507228 isoform X2 [Nematostella vectensis]